jgi:hypothetical protein
LAAIRSGLIVLYLSTTAEKIIVNAARVAEAGISSRGSNLGERNGCEEEIVVQEIRSLLERVRADAGEEAGNKGELSEEVIRTEP